MIKILKYALMGFAAVGATFALVLYGRTIASLDPFLNMRRPAPGLGSNVGIRLEDVKLTHYKAGKVLASADVGQVDIRQDRQVLDLLRIKNGIYNHEEGAFNFSAQRAEWYASKNALTVRDGAKVVNKDLDLAVPAFTIDQNQGTLVAPGEIKGRLHDGKVVASNLRYTLKTGNFKVNAPSWEGTAALALQEGDRPKKSFWKLRSDGEVSHDGDIDTWPAARATDGDVYVKADMVERNSKTDVLTATGNVIYYSSKINVTCDKAVIYRKEKRAVMSGKVNVLFKAEETPIPTLDMEIKPVTPVVPAAVASSRPPAPRGISAEEKALDEEVRSAKTSRKYPVAASCEQVEYWYAKGSRRAVITGNPQARQLLPRDRWREVTTHQAFYDGEKETLRLASRLGQMETKIRTSLGDDLTCPWFEISTSEVTDKWKAGAGMVGHIAPDDDDESPPSGSGSTGGG